MVCGEAADGREAVELARQLHPDVVLMDVSMPRMDGIEATRIVRRELPESKVVIVSHDDPLAVSLLVREIGASGSISKSNLASDLIPVIEKTIAGTDGVRADESEPLPAHFIGGGELRERVREN